MRPKLSSAVTGGALLHHNSSAASKPSEDAATSHWYNHEDDEHARRIFVRLEEMLRLNEDVSPQSRSFRTFISKVIRHGILKLTPPLVTMESLVVAKDSPTERTFGDLEIESNQNYFVTWDDEGCLPSQLSCCLSSKQSTRLEVDFGEDDAQLPTLVCMPRYPRASLTDTPNAPPSTTAANAKRFWVHRFPRDAPMRITYMESMQFSMLGSPLRGGDANSNDASPSYGNSITKNSSSSGSFHTTVAVVAVGTASSSASACVCANTTYLNTSAVILLPSRMRRARSFDTAEGGEARSGTPSPKTRRVPPRAHSDEVLLTTIVRSAQQTTVTQIRTCLFAGSNSGLNDETGASFASSGTSEEEDEQSEEEAAEPPQQPTEEERSTSDSDSDSSSDDEDEGVSKSVRNYFGKS